MRLTNVIADHISRSGPMAFDEFMEVALYHPTLGYFAAADRVRSAASGDFLTSPEVSPLFGEMLAVHVERERTRLGEPDPLRVVDAGAGSGSLLRSLIAALDGPVEAWAVELSVPARDRLAALLGADRVVASLAELPGDMAGVVVANELLDNLPAALAVRRGAAWRERRVVLADDGSLQLRDEPPRPEVSEWAERYGLPCPDGGQVEVQHRAGQWVEAAVRLLAGGSVVVIDYGDTADGLASRRAQGTLRTYRGHHLGPDPLLAPGETDITSDVNFTAVVEAARRAGAEVEYLRQDDFLRRLGLDDRLAELRRRELDLARAGDAVERLRVRAALTDGRTLLHPRGLGDFRVLVARR